MSAMVDFRVADPVVRRGRLPTGVAFVLQASIVVSFLAGSAAPTPLYPIYQAQWGFTPIMTTVVFGVYALAVLAALLIAGSLSDHVGRRPVLIAGIAVQAVTMIVFATADGVPALLVARIIQGLSTGATVGAVGAAMLDIDKARGTITNAVVPLLGTATGAIASGLFVQYLPAPEQLVYLVLLGIFVLQGIGVVLMPETAEPTAGAVASLRPRFGVPRAARRPLLLAAPVLVAVWALAGFYASVGPAALRLMVGTHSVLVGGLGLFVLAGCGGLTVLLSRHARPRAVMVFGTLSLFVGVGGTLVAFAAGSPALFFASAAVAGAGFGGGFQGAIRTVVPLAAPHERSGLLSIVYVVCYLALGLPAVIGGFLVVHGGLAATTREYGIAVLVLVLLALVVGNVKGTRVAGR